MTKRKRYTITTETVVTTGDFTEAQIEHIQRKFHGYVGIFEVPKLDYQAIAQELRKEQQK